MQKNRRLAIGCLVLAWLLSDLMCMAAAYNYGYLQACHWCSAPAWTALWLCLPFGAGIAVCGGLARWLWRRSKM